MQFIPLWLFWAVVGHLANGAAFVIDKTLLRSSFKHPATYAAMIGCLGLFAVVLLPFGVHIPTVWGSIWIVISGATFVFSLWAFFAALARGEASRVVPIIGSLTPILTLIGTSLFLGERLSASQFIGFALLIVATVILSGGATKSRLSAETLKLSVLAALLFGVASVTVKLAYEQEGFITAFTLSRFFGVIAAGTMLWFERGAYQELRNAFFPRTKRTSKGSKAISLVVAAQTLGGLGYVGVQYATSLGSAALVNALQAVQYALLVAVALLFRRRAPTLLGEDLTIRTVLRKSVAIVIAAAGMWMVI